MEQNAQASSQKASKRLLFPHKKGGVLRASVIWNIQLSMTSSTHNAPRSDNGVILRGSELGFQVNSQLNLRSAEKRMLF
ncbi:hypothetical protein NPIL_304551 [Nephila pilipes]|uniref:Uncharacterized protein n=1 Tax=Nephila pilipes TaxID=299642 RepID=A0A8X6TXU9_NEPPI|nr:hypothetical protein NPIL_304551 [Nephila pilipes]